MPESYVLAANAPTKTARSTKAGTITKDSLPSHCKTTTRLKQELDNDNDDCTTFQHMS